MEIEEYERKINQIFSTNAEKEISVSFILSWLNLSNLDSGSGYLKYPKSAVGKLYVFKLVKAFGNYSLLINYLIKYSKEAHSLGFYNNSKNELDLPPKRTFNYYLEKRLTKEQVKTLTSLAELITRIATQRKILLDLPNIKDTINSKRDYNRETKEIIRLVRDLVYPYVDIPMHHNAKINTKEMLDILAYTGLTGDFITNGSECYKLNSPNAPSGDLIRHHFSKFKSNEEIKDIFKNILKFVFIYAKRNFKYFNAYKINIAYDIHKIAYWGKGMHPTIRSSEFQNGTSDFFQYLTCSCVLGDRRFILDVVPFFQLDHLPKILDESLQRVKNMVKIELALFDRGFNSAEIFRMLKRNHIKFLMPLQKNSSVKNAFDKSMVCPARIFKDFMYGTEPVNLILVDDENGEKHAFVSNFDIAPCLAYRLYWMYSARWGIETSYRQLDHDFLAKTTSKNYHIRLFYFLFSTVLFNLWVLVNICVSFRIYGRMNKKPLVTSKLFITILCSLSRCKFNDDG